jgi:DNA ligase-associated metallophosphoesterase
MSPNLIICNHHFNLLPQKAIFWQEHQCLIIADLHLGKTSHFRKNGIALSNDSAQKDLEKLQKLILEKQPKSIIILGDLFHSDYNSEWEKFKQLRNYFSAIQFILVKGNHDIIHPAIYQNAEISVHERLVIDGFLFSHDKTENIDCVFQFYGHTHPGIKIMGKGKQSLKLPCFAQKGNMLMLPAFGELMGLHLINRKDFIKIYPVVSNKIIML